MNKSPLSDAEKNRFQAAVDLIHRAFEIIDNAVKEYEKAHGLTDPSRRRPIMEIAESDEGSLERKAEMVIEIMQSLNSLGPLDDLRNETTYLSEHFDEFVRSGIVGPSEAQALRDEFYEILSVLMIAEDDEEEDE